MPSLTVTLARTARRCVLLAGVLCAARARPALAQGEVTLSGHVYGPGGTPLAGARVQVTTERGETGEAISDSAGAYAVRVRPSGSYVVSAESSGINPVTQLVHAAAQSAEVKLDLRLLSRAVPLRPLTVRVPRLTVAGATAWTPGATEESRSGYELQRDPLGSDDLSDLAGREIGVARTPAGDGAGVSITGQAPEQTRMTLDGGDAPGGAIPREAVQGVAVLTNAYDVSRGRFTGGQLDVRTQGAGNAWGGSLRLDRRDPRLRLADAPGALRARGDGWSVDGGGGGALVHDRLFAFGALAVRRDEGPAPWIERMNATELGALGLSADSVARFLALTAGARPAGASPSNAGSTFGSGLLRLDAALSRLHTLTLRLNGQSSRSTGDPLGLSVAGTSAAARGSGGAAMAVLASGDARVANELRLNLARGSRRSTSSDPAPLGIVSVASGGDGETALASLRFAGSPLGESETRTRSFDLSDQAVLVNPGHAHRLRLGAEAGRQDYDASGDRGSSAFYFSSLGGLEGGMPTLFTRSFGVAPRTAEVRRAALFADDHWRSGRLDLDVGLRAEHVSYPRQAEAAPEVAGRFGTTPGRVPARWTVSPRVGFSVAMRMPWQHAGDRSSLSGGFGDFAGVLPLSSLASALAETGLASDAELVCAGPAAPAPDWAAYRADPGSVPSACAGGPSSFATRLAPATLFAPGFQAPRVRRASLEGQGALAGGTIWKVTAAVLRGVHPVAFDRNLRADPAFSLAAERGRAVYVPPAAIDPATGTVGAGDSRRFGDLGTVREVTAEGRSRAVQLGASLFRLQDRSWFSLGYTWTRARETVGPLSAPGGAPASTGASAFETSWAPSAYAPRHLLFVTLERRLSRRLAVSAEGHLSSGTPFTPMAAGDVNGDGARNDRAFVFDPASADPAVAASMRRLLDDAPAGVSACLRRQLGRIAAPNSCRTGWSPSLDVSARLQVGPYIAGTSHRRVTVWASAQNVTGGLDYLLHDAAHRRGWGQLAAPDATLLSVRSFDPAARAFGYDVNDRFGRPLPGAGLPFSISIQARVVVGNDAVLSAVRRELAGSGAEPLTPGSLRVFLARQWTNVPAEVLARNAPLRLFLTPAQVARLQAAADSAAARRAPVLDEMVELLTGARNREARTLARVRELRDNAVAERRAGAEAARAVLTPEQWARLPETLRSPGAELSILPPRVLTSGEQY